TRMRAESQLLRRRNYDLVEILRAAQDDAFLRRSELWLLALPLLHALHRAKNQVVSRLSRNACFVAIVEGRRRHAKRPHFFALEHFRQSRCQFDAGWASRHLQRMPWHFTGIQPI